MQYISRKFSDDNFLENDYKTSMVDIAFQSQELVHNRLVPTRGIPNRGRHPFSPGPAREFPSRSGWVRFIPARSDWHMPGVGNLGSRDRRCRIFYKWISNPNAKSQIFYKWISNPNAKSQIFKIKSQSQIPNFQNQIPMPNPRFSKSNSNPRSQIFKIKSQSQIPDFQNESQISVPIPEIPGTPGILGFIADPWRGIDRERF